MFYECFHTVARRIKILFPLPLIEYRKHMSEWNGIVMMAVIKLFEKTTINHVP